VDKNEFYGNFHPKCFFSFAVTLFARPKKLDAGDHGCFASPSYDEQVIVGRKVVLIGFFGNLRRRFLIKSPLPCSTCPPSRQKTASAGFYMRQVHSPTKIKRGRDFYTPGFLPDLARSSPVSHTGSQIK